MLAGFVREGRKWEIGKEDERHDCLVCSFRVRVVAVFYWFLFLEVAVVVCWRKVGLGGLINWLVESSDDEG